MVRKRVTVVFCDLTGSTALGEQLDPEALRATLRRYYEESRTILERHGGTVEKFIGDAVMAVFGVPQAHEDDAQRALRAAVELREAVSALGLRTRIGVNSGEVVTEAGDGLVTGDAVNVAARLEQAADPGEILIGDETRRLVRDAVRVEPLELELKGKSAPVRAFRLEALDADAPALNRRPDSPLVGRTRELKRLRDDYEEAVAQRSSRLFTLLGEAGVGKSRLVAEFLGELDGRGRVVRGRCLPYGEGITYWPVIEVVLQLGAEPDAVLSLTSPAEAAVATRRLLEAAAAEQPLVVMFDDIQWAEPTFLDLIEHVVDWSRAAPILVLCIARPELLDVRPGWGGGKPNATALMLDALPDAEASQLIDNLTGADGVDDDLRGRILRASAGNPLFVEEMLLMLREGVAGNVEVPPTIHALLQARLDSLDGEERAVIERGAVEGEVFHRAPVAELAPDPVRAGLDGHLERLIRTELIRPEAATMPGDDAFRFRHLLIRDAAYESLPKETRAALHERFALWLDEHVQLVEQDEIVGYHLEQAVRCRRELGVDDPRLAELASTRLAAAGHAAFARGDTSAAVSLIDRAAGLLPPSDPGRLELAADLVLALADLGRFADAQAYVDELAAADDERPRAYAATLAPVTTHMGGTGALEDYREDLVDAVATFERLGDERGLALALLVQGHDEWTRCRAGAAGERYRAARPHAVRAQRPSLARDAMMHLFATIAFGPAPVDEAEAELRALVDHATGVTLQAGLNRAMARVAATRGEFDTARELMRRGREPLRDAGLVVFHAATCLGAAYIEEHAEDYAEAVRLLTEGFEQLDELGEHAYASTVAADLADNELALGHEEVAARWLATARELCPPGDVATIVTADLVDALLHERRGALDDAERLADRAVAGAETTDFWELRGKAHEARAQVLGSAGRVDDARAALETARGIYRAKGAPTDERRAAALLAEL